MRSMNLVCFAAMGGVASVVVRYQNQVVGMYDCDGVMVARRQAQLRTPFCRRARSRSPGAVHADYPCMRAFAQCQAICEAG